VIARIAMAALLIGGPVAARAADGLAFAWQQHPGARLPLDTRVDEAGRKVAIGEAFGRAPVILDLGYYHCPSLCGVARSDMIAALGNSGMVSGRDFSVVVLSIDPAETPADAARAKAADLAQAPFATSADWHYFTGSSASIDSVADAVGFRDRYDEALKQFMHPAGIVVLTKGGVVSSYLLGVGYSGGELRAAVLRAGSGGIARAALPILLLCFHFDAATGRYTLAVVKLLKMLAALTVAGVLGLLFALSRARRVA
jgi:protein SCO1/2